MNNLFETIDCQLDAEQFIMLCQQKNVKIERIVSSGQQTPNGQWYDQSWDEWVLVLQGHAQLRINETLYELHVGDYQLIPAHCRHRVEFTASNPPTIWLAVHIH